MKDQEAQFIDVADLRVGDYVYLDLGWMDHPFALNSFRIGSQEQIETIRGLGLERVRYSPEQSLPQPTAVVSGMDVAAPAANAATTSRAAAPGARGTASGDSAAEAAVREQRRQRLQAQRASLQRCETRFADATGAYRRIMDAARARPAMVQQQCDAVITTLLSEMNERDETAIRLLSEKAGEKTSLHAINVTVISLLLGQALNFGPEQMQQLGAGALLHDLGKMDLAESLRWRDEHYSAAERLLYREHVAHGVNIARKIDFPREVQLIIAQHHEFDDGSGYPLGLKADQIFEPARVVALVNHYDNLCNPGNPGLAVTPHEALALIYAQGKHQFDARALALFIRMMGVYPPGSVVELSDGRFALVASVNSTRPLRPHIVIHDPEIPADEALIVDLEQEPLLGIRRSIKPLQLPRAAFDYLSPRKRLCYFFERGRDAAGTAEEAKAAAA